MGAMEEIPQSAISYDEIMDKLAKFDPEEHRKLDAQIHEMIASVIQFIGYDKVLSAVIQAANDAITSTNSQALTAEGAFAQEVAEIVKRYPNGRVRFGLSPEGSLEFTCIITREDDEESFAPRFKEEVDAALKRHVKVKPHLVKTHMDVTVRVADENAESE